MIPRPVLPAIAAVTGKAGFKPVGERFWAKVDRRSDDECWLWQASVSSCGYGQFNIGGKVFISSRVAWALVKATEPGEQQVCHHCDTPACCNPAHLFLGTQRDNIADMVAKNRARSGGARGERQWKTRLTEAQVLHIRSSPRKSADLARELGVWPTAICNIRKGRTWAWLTAPESAAA